MEDGPDEFEVIAESYQALAGNVIGHKYGMGNIDDGCAEELADFFHFKYLEEIKDFVKNNDWEENIASFALTLENRQLLITPPH